MKSPGVDCPYVLEWLAELLRVQLSAELVRLASGPLRRSFSRAVFESRQGTGLSAPYAAAPDLHRLFCHQKWTIFSCFAAGTARSRRAVFQRPMTRTSFRSYSRVMTLQSVPVAGPSRADKSARAACADRTARPALASVTCRGSSGLRSCSRACRRAARTAACG